MRKQILVTDDESMVSESFRIALKDNYEVWTAACGRECLDIVRQRKPNLVVLDVCLPDMDGIAVLKEIRQINPGLPVIVITGMGTHKIAVEALRLGADDFIAKPLNFYYLRSTIANSLTNHKGQRQDFSPSEDIIIKNYLCSLKMLNKILEVRDPFTQKHSQEVGRYALMIAQELGLSQDEQEVIKETALLHDIGKVGISEAILHKPTKLTQEEWEEIRRHVQIGEELLEPLKVLHIEQSTIRHHHERYDGNGYPDRLKGERIPLLARILAVADSYEAMTANRPYRRAQSPMQALRELQLCSGTQFDPQVVSAFIRALKNDQGLFREGGEDNDPA